MHVLMMTGPSQGVDRTEVREIEAPRPGPGEVTIDVAHAGINFADVMARRGDAGYSSAWPSGPGVEVSGTVREAGPGVTGLAVGQRVAAFTGGGGLAEVARARAEHTVPVPGQVPSAGAAAAPLMLTTALLLLCDAARFRPGETVLVHSASGGVGGAVAKLVLALGGGLRIGTVGRPGKVASALKSTTFSRTPCCGSPRRCSPGSRPGTGRKSCSSGCFAWRYPPIPRPHSVRRLPTRSSTGTTRSVVLSTCSGARNSWRSLAPGAFRAAYGGTTCSSRHRIHAARC